MRVIPADGNGALQIRIGAGGFQKSSQSNLIVDGKAEGRTGSVLAFDRPVRPDIERGAPADAKEDASNLDSAPGDRIESLYGENANFIENRRWNRDPARTLRVRPEQNL